MKTRSRAVYVSEIREVTELQNNNSDVSTESVLLTLHLQINFPAYNAINTRNQYSSTQMSNIFELYINKSSTSYKQMDKLGNSIELFHKKLSTQ